MGELSVCFVCHSVKVFLLNYSRPIPLYRFEQNLAQVWEHLFYKHAVVVKLSVCIVTYMYMYIIFTEQIESSHTSVIEIDDQDSLEVISIRSTQGQGEVISIRFVSTRSR